MIGAVPPFLTDAQAAEIRAEQDMLREQRKLERDRRWTVMFSDALDWAFIACCAVWGL